MRSFKRNAVIITVVLFVCVAAYLNWSYSQEDVLPDLNAGADAQQTMDILAQDPNAGNADVNANTGASAGVSEGDDTGLYYQAASVASYFAEARLARQQARDNAVETLASINNDAGASQEVVDSALSKIAAIAASTQKEAELEMLIRAKGFADCVVFVSEDGVKVTVPAPSTGLSAVDVAKITDIVTTETVFKAASLNIIEVKA
ncbi:MAG: SpoIIIAH-like family protein [Oscillospiraceae bacterium]|jgi:stage III sporulation protein AH|nr:SpoIIIAH-like family protein [Oscillospiraceae bacterium]